MLDFFGLIVIAITMKKTLVYFSVVKNMLSTQLKLPFIQNRLSLFLMNTKGGWKLVSLF